MKRSLLLLLLACAGPITLHAAVPAEEAARLGRDLTPQGGETAGNEDGSIPAWSGGLTSAPDCYQGEGHRYCDPFADEKALFSITGENLDAYRSALSQGQQAMLERYPSLSLIHI